jgi:PncC family amidohydrolase
MKGCMMRELMPLAERAAALLKARKQTIALNESSTGGLISAALLAVPGASAYYIGSVVVYTRQAWNAVRDFREEELGGVRAATEHNALVRARIARERFATTWGIGETGAAGPSGNRYGDPAGHTCVAIAGPVERALTLRTGKADRMENMYAFADAALKLLVECLEAQR